MKINIRYIAFCIALSFLLQGCSNLPFNFNDISKSRATDPQSADGYIAAGDSAFRSGNTDDALVQYVLALEQDNNNANTYYKIGTIHRTRGNLEIAESSFQKAISLDDQHLPSREGLGLVYLRKEHYGKASTLLESVLESDSNRPDTLNALGVLYDLQESYGKSIQKYSQALELNPKSAKINNNLGYSYYLQENYDKAIEQFRTVLDIDPSFDRAWSNLALAYLQSGYQDDASKAFNQIVKPHQTLNNLGYLHILLNNKEVARELLDRSLANAPSYYPVAIQNLESLDSRQDSLARTMADDRAVVGFEQEITTLPANSSTGEAERRVNRASEKILHISH